jgi:ABC-type Fe3+-hydroxamate transport system substrate-binding protein
MNIIAAITAIAKLPDALTELTKELKELGNKLNKAKAAERLASKRKRNTAAVRDILGKRVSGAETGHGGGDNKPPTV